MLKCWVLKKVEKGKAMINIVLYRPQMPQNAGNIIRLSANCGAKLHFVGPLDFFMDDKKMLRAGLDYHEIANLTVHTSFEKFLEKEHPLRLIASTVHGKTAPSDFKFEDSDYLLFGRETSGLPDEIMQQIPISQQLRIPMVEKSRCLNLSNAVAVMAYEAWRQLGFIGAKLP